MEIKRIFVENPRFKQLSEEMNASLEKLKSQIKSKGFKSFEGVIIDGETIKSINEDD